MRSHARALFAVSILFVALLFPAQALGARTVVKTLGAATTGTTGGLFNTPRGVAVNQSGSGATAGTFYVVDSLNHRIQQFNPAGEFVRTWGWGVTDGLSEYQSCKVADSCKAGIAGSGSGQMNLPQGIALDQATGNLYVSDQLNRRIDVFGANGAFQGAFGYGVRTGKAEFEFCTTSCVAPNTAAGAQGGRFGSGATAIQIGGLAVAPNGNLYVANKTNRRVEVFKPILTGSVVSNAEFIHAYGFDVQTGGVTTFEVCAVAASCKQGSAGSNPGQFFNNSPVDVAVDSESNIYAVDASSKRVQKFSSAPALITEKFAADAIANAFGTTEGQQPLAIAVDPSSAPNRVLLSAHRAGSEGRLAVLEMDHNGNELYLHGEELTPASLAASPGLAVAKASIGGNLYLSSQGVGTQGAFILNESPTVEAASGIGAHEATLHGQVVSNEANVQYRFEYVAEGGAWTKLPASDASAGASTATAAIASTGPSAGTLTVNARGGAFTLTFNAETTAPLAHDASASAVQSALEALTSIGAGNVAVSGGPGSPDGSTPYAISFQGALAGTEVTQISAFAANLLAPTIAVSQAATGLHGNTKYQVRLVATRPSGGLPITSGQAEFTTLASAPGVSATTASSIGDDSAKLEGEVNPENQPTSYQFEYLTQAAYEANGNSFAGLASKAPASPAGIGSGIADLPVAEQIGDLEPATTYRFRLSATNATGTTTGAEQTFVTHAQTPLFEPCANDQFRTGPSANLPDCRAYEQASPVEKNGTSIQGTSWPSRAAASGAAVSFESSSGIPGGEGAQNLPTYLARRTPDGWTIKGLLPPPSSGQVAGVRGWTPDFATVFNAAELLGQGNSFLARSTAGEAETEVVPHTLPLPTYSYLGGSADKSKLAFEAEPAEAGGGLTLQLSPDAAPGKPNVYAFDRATGELRLAGVLPDGSTPPEGSQAGRGAALDAFEYNQDKRAVGAEGSVLFSDRKDGQLYLRLNPTEEDASTVHVSATRKDNGKGPGGRDSAGPQSATLMAASADHSLITFTSSEKLTNDANTGIEPTPPAIARAKASDGGEKDLEFIPAFAHEIAIDNADGYVYWSDPANGQIGRAKLDGTEFDESYVTGLGEPRGIAVINDPAAKYIFWTERGELTAGGKAQAGKGTIGRADLDGTNVDEECLKELTNPRSIAADASFIYWTMPGITGVEPGLGQGDLARASLACDPLSITTLIDGLASGDVAVNATHIYYSFRRQNLDEAFIGRANLDGTSDAPVVRLDNAGAPPSIALDSGHLYWTHTGARTVGRSDLSGTDASEEPNFITEAGRPEDLAVSSEHLFWSVNQDLVPNPGKDIYQLDLSGDSPELTDLAPDSIRTNGVEVQGVLGSSEDGSYVYFAANGVPDELGNSPNEMGEVAEPGNCEGTERSGASGTCNLYVAHDGEVDFIARLKAEPPSEKDSGDVLNWAAGHLDALKFPSDKTAKVSADGQALVFRSSRQLTEYDNQGPRCGVASDEFTRAPGPCLEFYRYDYAERHLVCLTCDPRGATPEGPARLSSLQPPNLGAQRPAMALGRNLSSDGERFFFETPDALVAADTNGEDGCPPWGSGNQDATSRACQDVYEWEAPGTGSCTESSPAYSTQNEGCIYLISTGKGKEATFFADADLNGENAFIFTFEQLVPQDEDELLDAYDVRVGGGLASQHQVDAPPCLGEACKGEPAPPSTAQTPGSSSFTGPPNTKDRKPKARRCAKGKRRVRAKGKVRCVSKRQRSKAQRRKRAANKSRGAGR